MTRTTYRRTPKFEGLEKREVLSGPSADAQYMLELVNLARTDPHAAADRFTSNLDPNVVATLNYYNIDLNAVKNTIANTPAQPPLAWNDQLAQAAQDHSQDMANTGVQSHTGSNGSRLWDRLDQAGYTNRSDSTENAYAYSTSVNEAMQAFLIDWGVSSNGHRDNLMQPGVSPDQARRDVGIGIVASNKPGFGPLVVTQDFGSQNGEKAQLLGVAFNDGNGDNFYGPGEGQANVTISATNLATGQTSNTQTQSAGGYQMPLDPGSYSVSATFNGQVVRSQNIQIGSQNVEVDYNLSQAWQGTPASTSVPAPSPSSMVVAAQTLTPPPSAPAPVAVPSNVVSNAAFVQPPPAARTVSPLFSFFTFNRWTSWSARKFA